MLLCLLALFDSVVCAISLVPTKHDLAYHILLVLPIILYYYILLVLPIIGLDWRHSESLQFLSYKKGQYFSQHADFFATADNGTVLQGNPLSGYGCVRGTHVCKACALFWLSRHILYWCG